MDPEVKKTHPYKSTTHEERFMHFKLGEHGLLPEHPLASHVTVFLRREDGGSWYLSFALCSKKDQFSRRIGRQVARRRYFGWTNPKFYLTSAEKIEWEEVRTWMHDIVANAR